MNLILLAIFSTAFIATELHSKECVPAKEYIDFPEEIDYGMYYRFSPDGSQIIASMDFNNPNDGVSLINIREDESGTKKASVIHTKMHGEAYPVEGYINSQERKYEWKLISSPRDSNGGTYSMKYFEVNTGGPNDVSLRNNVSDFVFEDKKHNEYYHSAGTLTPQADGKVRFRTMLWSNSRIKDYEMTEKPDGSRSVKATSGTYDPCGNLGQMQGPILSKDTNFVSFTQGHSTVIYSIDYKSKECKLVSSLGYNTSKVSFSYPSESQRVGFKGSLSVETESGPIHASGIFTYNFMGSDLPENQRTQLISDPKKEEASGYPGFLEDGRGMYIANVKQTSPEGAVYHRDQIVIADAKQLKADGSIDPNPADCIALANTKQSSSPTGESNSSGAVRQ